VTFYSPQQFQAGFRLFDGTQQNTEEGNPKFSTEDAVVATGTTVADAKQLNATVNVIVTAAASTGVLLPIARPGLAVYVFNRGASPVRVYGQPGDLVDTVASVVLTNALRAVYFCVAPNTWFSAQLGVASA
jgi:hypothetical protein